MADATPYLLDLPMETLQHISRFVEPEWLPVLRLTCRTLYHTADHAFARHYLHDLHCFVLHPARIGRLRQIMFTPHMASHVRRLTLTVGFFERSESTLKMPTVLGRYVDELSSHESLVRDVAHQSFLHWETALSGEWIYPSLAMIDPKRCKISLELLATSYFSPQYTQPGIVQLLRAARSLKFDIDDVILDDAGLCYPLESAMSREEVVSTLARSLKGLHFVFTCATLSSAPVTLEIARQAKELQQLSINALARTASHRALPATSPQQLWMGTDLSCIKELRLTGIHNVTFSELASLFERCCPTLQSLDMSWIWALEPGRTTGWSSIFSRLQAAPRLQNLALANLHEFVRGDADHSYRLINAKEDRPTDATASSDDTASMASKIEVDLRTRAHVQECLAYLSRCTICADPFAQG